MADVVIFHNPNCSTSRYAVEQADEAGVDYEVVKYMLKAERPDRAAIETLVAQLEDPATDLVRRDAVFKKLGLTDGDVETADHCPATNLSGLVAPPPTSVPRATKPGAARLLTSNACQ